MSTWISCCRGSRGRPSRVVQGRPSRLVHIDEEETVFIPVDVSVVQFKRRHAQFWKNFRLSFFVGILRMVFGSFSYSQHARYSMFGDPDACEEKDLGFVWLEGVQTWCGWMPNSYATNWSYLMMMIILTVYRNTGNTIMFAWQGVAGTAVALVNLWVMQLIFGKCANNIIVWLDITLFYVVVLCSGAAVNTMIFALNWHSYFMMDFLNPQKRRPSEFPMFVPYLDWDSSHVMALATSIGGASLAIIATLIPVPITLSAQIQDDAEIIVTGADKIWTAAIDYMCGAEPSAKQDQIVEAVSALSSTVSQVQGNLADSWWENFDIGSAAKRNLLYAHFDDTCKKVNDVKVVMAASLSMASFTYQSRKILGGLREEMHHLRSLSVVVLTMTVEGAADGNIDEEEYAKLEQTCKQLRAAQEQLYEKYLHLARGDIAKGAPSCSNDLMQELTFLFTLSAWGDEVQKFAEDTRDLSRDLDEHHSALKDVGRLGVVGFRHIFGIPTHEKVKFAVRSFTTIGGSFIAGYAWGGRGRIFPEYSAVMPATLSLMLHAHGGGEILNNLKRLLGVVLGKVGPLVIVSMMEVLGSYVPINNCGSWSRDVIIGLSTFFLSWCGDYVYFTNPGYAIVGFYMAAYGTDVFSSECGSQGEKDFITKYKETAQILCAILISLCVDKVFEIARKSYPRDVAVRDVDEMNRLLCGAYDSYFAGDVKSAKEQMKGYKTWLSCAESMTAHADPSNEFCASYRAPFRLGLYKDSMGTYEALRAEMSVLIMATEGRSGTGNIFDCINDIESIGSLQTEFLQVTTTVLQSLRNMLAHGAEDNSFQDPEEINALIEVSERNSLESLDWAIADLNKRRLPALAKKISALFEDPRVRVTVAIASFNRSKVHLAEVDKMLLKRIML